MGYLARSLTGSPLLILLTYRDDEPDGLAIPLLDTPRWAARVPAAVADLITPTGRRPAMSRLSLSGLSLSTLDSLDLTTLVSELLGGEPPPGLIPLLAERSAGVPLFAQALISTLAATGSFAGRGAVAVAADRGRPHAGSVNVDAVELAELLSSRVPLTHPAIAEQEA